MTAHAWRRQGNLSRAIVGYQHALELQLDYAQAHIELVEVLLQLVRIPEALVAVQRALDLYPNEAVLHKSFVQASMTHTGNFDEAQHYYQLTRCDQRAITILPEDILCCCVVRNEVDRLAYFLAYYREKGITQFLFVDNASTDGTLPFLLEQKDVLVWRSPYSFNRANFGSAWFELILRQHGIGHWCVIVDADELLYYPECERKSFSQLCQELEVKQKSAFNAIHLEMYSDKPIKDTLYVSGQPFEDVCPYFDKQYYHETVVNAGPFRNQIAYFGGARARIFGTAANYYLSKVPLLKYNSDVVLTGGQHWTSYDRTRIANGRGALLHFKFFSNFANHVKQEAHREEHCFNARLYKEYTRGIEKNEALNLYDELHSVKLEDSGQLLRLGIIESE